MDEQAKKTALRMIPYGLYVMTAAVGDDKIAAATVNWVTQASFQPPVVAVGVKKESGIHALAQESGFFALNILGKGQQGAAFAFFKAVQRDDNTINGEPFNFGSTGAPVLESVPAVVECKLVKVIPVGDHDIFLGEVVEAQVREIPEGRPDAHTLRLEDLGENVFYGG